MRQCRIISLCIVRDIFISEAGAVLHQSHTHSASHYRTVIIWNNCSDNLCSSGHVNGEEVEDTSSILQGNGPRAKGFRKQEQDRLKIQSALVIMEISCDEEVSLILIRSCSNEIAASRIHSHVPCKITCIIISIVYDPGHLIKHNPGAEALFLTLPEPAVSRF